MANELGSVSVSVKAETSQLEVGLSKARAETEKFDKAAGRVASGGGRKLTESSNKINSSMSAMGKSTSQLTGLLTKLGAVMGVVFASAALRGVTALVEKYDEMAERVRMASRSQEEFEVVQRRLMDTANGTFRSLSEAQELYIRTADSLRSMGFETSEVLDITDSMSFALVKNAASTDRANNAISAYSKSINKGKVEADAWESIISAMPTIIDDVAQASGRSAAQIRKLGAAGKLTANDLNKGLLASLESNKAAADGMATTVKDAGVQLSNALAQTLSALNKQTGALDAMVESIQAVSSAVKDFGEDSEGMASAINTASTIALSFAAVIAGRVITALTAYTAALTRTAISNLTATKSAVGFSAAVGIQTTAVTASTVALNAMALAARGLRVAMAFLGGPVGVALLAAVALFEFAGKSETAKDRTAELDAQVIKLTQSFKNLSRAQLDIKLAELAVEAVELTGKIDNLRIAQGKANKVFAETSGVLGGAAIGISAYSKATQGLAEQDQDGLDLTQRLEANKLAAEAARKAIEDLGKPVTPAAKVLGDGGEIDQSLLDRRKEAIADLKTEVRILDDLSKQYINAGLSAELLATKGEILRTQGMLKLNAMSAEGQAIADLIVQRDALMASIETETALREKAQKAREDFTARLEGVQEQITDIETETHALGLATQAGEKYRMEQELINAATKDFNTLTEDQIAQIQGIAEKYAAASAELKGVQEQQALAEEQAQRMADAQQRFQETLASGLTDALLGAKSAGDAFNALALEIAKAVIQAEILAMIQQGMGKPSSKSGGGGSAILGAFASIAGMFDGGTTAATAATPSGSGAGFLSTVQASRMHTGGTVGQASNSVSMPASSFINAPRFHDGLRADEFPAILQNGEEVVPKDKVGARGGVTNINNWNITTPDPNAFRESQRQINRKIAVRAQTR